MRTIKSFKWMLLSISAASFVLVGMAAENATPKPGPATKTSYMPVVA